MALWFFSTANLKRWLGGHPNGVAVIEEAMETRCGFCTRVQRQPVLVILDAEGGLEVYGDRRDIGVVVAHKLVTTMPETERLAEDYLESTLPPALRWLYHPRHLRTVDRFRPRTAGEELERLWRLDWLKALAEVLS
jgi:hypothetical protein